MRGFTRILLPMLLTWSCLQAGAVINGQFLRGPDFHWVVFIQSNSGYRCTGSLIHPEWVLTAAHCVRDQLTVMVMDYPRDYDFEGLQDMEALDQYYQPRTWSQALPYILHTREVVDVISHPDFALRTKPLWKGGPTSPKPCTHDMALLKLSNPLDVSLPKIATPEDLQELESLDYVQMVAAGFGRNGPVGAPLEQALPSFLKMYYFTTLKRSGFFDLRGPRCYHETGIGFRPGLVDTEPTEPIQAMVAPGDSGGPLMAYLSGEWKLVGVTDSVIKGRRGQLVQGPGTITLPQTARHIRIESLCDLGMGEEIGISLCL